MRYLVNEEPWIGKSVLHFNQYTSSELKQSSNLIALYLQSINDRKVLRKSHFKIFQDMEKVKT